MNSIPHTPVFGTIYGLIDPRDGCLRYIGKTKHKPASRLKGHLRDKCICKRTGWLKRLVSLGLLPRVVVIEVVPLDELTDAEVFWIAYVRSVGATLLNQTDGGDGQSHITAEVRMKMSLALKGKNTGPRPPEVGLRISQSKKGRGNGQLGCKHSAERRMKVSLANKGKTSWLKGKKQSPEYIAKRALARTGIKMTPEQKRRISENHGGAKPVICLETGETFPSSFAASRSLGLTEQAVMNAIRAGCRAGGYRWARREVKA